MAVVRRDGRVEDNDSVLLLEAMALNGRLDLTRCTLERLKSRE